MPIFPTDPMSPHQEAQMPPLTLAYLGDTLYDLYVRTRLVAAHCDSTGRLNRMAIAYVSAVGQSRGFKAVWDSLSEEEQQVAKRGRNAKSPTAAKNAPIQDYRYATAMETLLGYLYLSGQEERARDIMQRIYEATENPIGKEDENCPK